MIDIKRETPSIDRRERMLIESLGVPIRPAAERVRDFDEVFIPFTPEQAIHEARRCIHCPDPSPCQKACPARNDVSFAMWLIEQGKFIEAARLYRQTSSMPEICGRVCPQDKLCEGACVRGRKDAAPVSTGSLEAFVADHHRQKHGVNLQPGPSSGKKVAIVGAGPAGLACAEQLVKFGHWVTLFDSKPAPGGLLTYGIPNFKLPKKVVMALWNDLEQAGVSFVGNTTIGRTKMINDLYHEGYDAIFIGVGTGVDTTMNAPGEDLPGVYKATEFLIRANVDPAILPTAMSSPPEIGDKVVVVGGGDTSSDCLRTALRLGAKEVINLYRRTEDEMPGRSKDRHLAMEEGAQFEFLIQPISFIAGANGRLAQIECIRMELGEPGLDGRRKPLPVKGTNFFMDVDTAILALGYYPDPTIGATTPGLRTHKWGLIMADHETGSTSRFGLFTGGDIVSGPDLVVTAMVAGRKAAATIDAYLY